MKTGFTEQAGRCLISAAERNGVLLIVATLNAPDDWEDHMALLDCGFSRVEPYLLPGGDVKLAVPVVGSECQSLFVQGVNGGTVSLPSEDISRVERRVYAPAFLYAPVRAGDTVGEIRWYLEGDLLGSAPLTAGESAPLQEEEPGLWARFFGT